MVHRCDKCNYITNRYSNLLRHTNRKTSCAETNNEIEIVDDVQKYNKNMCDKCKRVLSNSFSLKRHFNVCKGVNAFTCTTCFKVFSSTSSKNNHVRKSNCTTPPPPPSIQNANVINNTTNNVNNVNSMNNNNSNNNIHINVFGNEDLNYLLNDKDIIQKLKSFGKSGIYGLPKILNEIHFNKDKPENSTMIKPDEYGNGVMIMNDEKEWEYREFEDIRENLINTIAQYFKAYNFVKNNLGVKLIEKKERNIVKNFAYQLLSLEGTIPPDLFQELDMNEEEVEDTEEEMKSKLRKFDKSTMKNLHNKTYLTYKKENGSYVKKY